MGYQPACKRIVIVVEEPFSKQMGFPIYGIIFAFLSAKAVSLRKVLQ
jgi:hypothetical protein